MTRSKSLLGMLVLSALAICAFAASSAQATTMHECIEKPEGPTSQTYSDSKCQTPSGEGKFRTVPLPANTPIKVEATLTPTKFVEEKEELHTVLTTTVGGIFIEITCTELSSPGATAENKETENEAKEKFMEVTGSGVVTYSGCTVPKPAGQNCTVHTTGNEVGMITTNSLSSKTIDTVNGEMHVEYTPTAGPEKEFVTLILEGCKTALLNGNKPIFGKAVGTQTTPTSLTINTSELHFGSPTGPAATYTATIHFRTAEGTKNTIAFETP